MMYRYPRTVHIEHSRRQPGDENLAVEPFERLQGRHVVIEEKVDGANSGISFNATGEMRLQSRGHFLTGGPRERHFALFKTWAACHQRELFAALSSRYVLYGEWLYAKHTIFYDALSHYFLEFDVLDTESDRFLSTDHRRSLLGDAPIVSVPVLWEGTVESANRLSDLVGPSRFKMPGWREQLALLARSLGLNPEKVDRQTDQSDAMEGLYVKVEEKGEVVERYKLIRQSFLTNVLDSDSHWLDRPIVPNQLAVGVDIFGPSP
ncbi:MAG TPA: RNA ligase family protein [Chloroflexota bacterium]|nr:RNA ligase family protein [Chloroflexota bacterium]